MQDLREPNLSKELDVQIDINPQWVALGWLCFILFLLVW